PAVARSQAGARGGRCARGQGRVDSGPDPRASRVLRECAVDVPLPVAHACRPRARRCAVGWGSAAAGTALRAVVGDACPVAHGSGPPPGPRAGPGTGPRTDPGNCAVSDTSTDPETCTAPGTRTG